MSAKNTTLRMVVLALLATATLLPLGTSGFQNEATNVDQIELHPSDSERGAEPPTLRYHVTVTPLDGNTGAAGPADGPPACTDLINTLLQPCAYFEEEFDAALDPLRWRQDIATDGVRICAFTVANHLLGDWRDMGTTACNGNLQDGPYGYVHTAGSRLFLGNGHDRAAPFIWTGPGQAPGPFPLKGDFTLDIRMRYTDLDPWGLGIRADIWPVGEPVATNNFVQRIFAIWGDVSGGLRVRLLDDVAVTQVSNPTGWHDYRLVHANGQYDVFVDGIHRLGPVAGPNAPDTIWIGNPTFTYWAQKDWSNIEIDHVRVTMQPIV